MEIYKEGLKRPELPKPEDVIPPRNAEPWDLERLLPPNVRKPTNEVYTQAAENYNRTHQKQGIELLREREAWHEDLTEVLTHARADLPLSPRVADFGCGTGNFIVRVRQVLQDWGLTPELSGSDGSKEMLDVARREVPGVSFSRLNLRDLEAIANISETYDMATFAQVLGTFTNPADILRGVGAHIRPRGYLLVCDLYSHPSRWTTLTPEQLAKRPLGIVDSTKPLEQVMTDAGFEVVKAGRLKRVSSIWTGQEDSDEDSGTVGSRYYGLARRV